MIKNHLTGCQNYAPLPTSRREMLTQCATGFGALAAAALLHDDAQAERSPNSAPHLPPRAKRVVFLHMDGGVSQVDSFDPKPSLDKHHDKPLPFAVKPTQFNQIGALMKSPWRFKAYGESGLPVSELFPHIASCADDLCVVRSMVTDASEHTLANYCLHTGSILQGRPSMAAWLSYGLGTENRDLPAFVVLNAGFTPTGGIDNFGSGFLPARHQGTVFDVRGENVKNMTPADGSIESQRGKMDFVLEADRRLLSQVTAAPEIEAAIANQELAFRMQTAVPVALELAGESEATKRLYGFQSPDESTQLYAKQCLLARRLLERGVRFVQVTQPATPGSLVRWDQHADIAGGHAENAHTVDQPIAGLLKDLKSRGLLEDTLVLWSGEFGRTPFAQGTGRDHNPHGFSLWMAGGGVRGGMTYGATDEFGYQAIENRLHIHDLHATMLHLMGIDHKRLTFRFGGRDFRLTDVYGNIAHDILA